MTEKISAVLSALRINAAGLSDAKNAEEAMVYAGIIFNLKCELERQLPGKSPCLPTTKMAEIALKTDVAF